MSCPLQMVRRLVWVTAYVVPYFDFSAWMNLLWVLHDSPCSFFDGSPNTMTQSQLWIVFQQFMQLLEWQLISMIRRQCVSVCACVMQVQPSWGNVTLVIAGLTNTYSSYVTTYEEYQAQRYEGASTIFGPHTLDAYIQVGHLRFGLDQSHHYVIIHPSKICFPLG